MPPTATATPLTHLDCTPFDVLAEGSLSEALRRPPLETLAELGWWFLVAFALVLSLAVVATVLGRRKPTESWVVLLAGVAALVAADAVWFDAAAAAERIRAVPWPKGIAVAWDGTRALSKGVVGLEIALAALALLPIARRRMRAKEGRPALRAALESLTLLAACALLAVVLDGVAERARRARVVERRERAAAREIALHRLSHEMVGQSDADLAYSRALAAAYDLDFADAERLFGVALAGRPDDVDILYARAKTRRDTAHPGAADDLRRVLELEPDHDGARALLDKTAPWRPRR